MPKERATPKDKELKSMAAFAGLLWIIGVLWFLIRAGEET